MPIAPGAVKRNWLASSGNQSGPIRNFAETRKPRRFGIDREAFREFDDAMRDLSGGRARRTNHRGGSGIDPTPSGGTFRRPAR